MNPIIKIAPPYKRPMKNWWLRDPFFVRYMVREATAVAVAIYAVILMIGLICLAQGETVWNEWLSVLHAPWSIWLHFVLLLAMVIHAYSWFKIMPKTMPIIMIGGHRVAASTITRIGWAAVVMVSVVIFMCVAS